MIYPNRFLAGCALALTLYYCTLLVVIPGALDLLPAEFFAGWPVGLLFDLTPGLAGLLAGLCLKPFNSSRRGEFISLALISVIFVGVSIVGLQRGACSEAEEQAIAEDFAYAPHFNLGTGEVVTTYEGQPPIDIPISYSCIRPGEGWDYLLAMAQTGGTGLIGLLIAVLLPWPHRGRIKPPSRQTAKA
jgi:hypothetical protein